MWIKREGKSRLLSIASKEWDFPPQPSGRAWCCSLSPDLEPLPIVLLPSREPAVEGTGRLEMRRHVMPQQPPNGKGGLLFTYKLFSLIPSNYHPAAQNDDSK
jgi:hypothetical protein